MQQPAGSRPGGHGINGQLTEHSWITVYCGPLINAVSAHNMRIVECMPLNLHMQTCSMHVYRIKIDGYVEFGCING